MLTKFPIFINIIICCCCWPHFCWWFFVCLLRPSTSVRQLISIILYMRWVIYLWFICVSITSFEASKIAIRYDWAEDWWIEIQSPCLSVYKNIYHQTVICLEMNDYTFSWLVNEWRWTAESSKWVSKWNAVQNDKRPISSNCHRLNLLSLLLCVVCMCLFVHRCKRNSFSPKTLKMDSNDRTCTLELSLVFSIICH